jgi:hypothetical protein
MRDAPPCRVDRHVARHVDAIADVAARHVRAGRRRRRLVPCFVGPGIKPGTRALRVGHRAMCPKLGSGSTSRGGESSI